MNEKVSQQWRGIEYDFPTAIYLLIITFFILYAYFQLYHYRKNKLIQVTGDLLIDQLVQPRSFELFWIKSLLSGLVWMCAVFALMQPKGNERYISNMAEFRQNNNDVLLCIDVSASMQATDMDEGKTRLQVAKEIAETIVNELPGSHVALFAFTNATLQMVPLTIDYFFTRMMINQIQINEGDTFGTDFKQLLNSIYTQILEKTSTNTAKTIIILSDGENTAVEGLTGEAAAIYSRELHELLKKMGEKSATFTTIGLGSTGSIIPNVTFQGHPVNSKLNLGFLKELTTLSNGHTYDANYLSSLQIANAIAQEIIHQSQAKKDGELIGVPIEQRLFDPYFQRPLIIAIIALLLLLVIPDTKKMLNKVNSLLLYFIFIPSILAAQELNVKQAITLYNAAEYVSANQKFEALLNTKIDYRQRAILDYNIGTTLLKLNQPIEAIKYFERSENYQHLSVLLDLRLKTNKLIAELKLPVDMYQLNDLFQELEELKLANCRLQAAEGIKECTPNSSIKAIEESLNTLLEAWLLKDNNSTHFDHLSQASNVELYDMLITQYLLATIELMKQTPIFNKQIKKIQTIYNEKFKTNSNLKIAFDYLSQAEKAYQNKQFLISRLFLVAALTNVEETKEIEESTQALSLTILKQGIRKQKTALQLVLILQQMDLADAVLHAAMIHLSDVQSHVLLAIEDFYSSIIAQQKKQWLTLDISSSYEKVIQLFAHGKQAAIESNDDIKAMTLNVSDLIFSQKKTVAMWKQALALLQPIVLSGASDTKEDRSAKNNEKKTLQTLLEMEQEDLSHSIIKIGSPTSLDTDTTLKRPW